MTEIAVQIPAGAPEPGAPAAAPAAAQQQPVNPMLDRSLMPDAQGNPAPQLSDAHLEAIPEPAPQQPEPSTEPVQVQDSEAASLRDMIGQELMQDPGASLVANSLLRLMGDKADHNRAFARAIAEGDVRFIDVAYLQDTLGADADEAIRAASYLLDYADNYTANLQQRLYSEVPGGEQAVQLAARHFRETATPAEHKMIVRLLDSGDFELMQYAVQTLVERAKGVMPPTGQQVHGTPQGVQPMTREEFGKAVLDNPTMTEQQYAMLQKRLAAGMRG